MLVHRHEIAAMTKSAARLALPALLFVVVSQIAQGQASTPATWIGPEAGGLWESDGNWDTGVHPNAPESEAILNSPNETRTMTLPVSARTIGALTLNNNSTLDTTFSSGTFRWNAVDAGPVRITVQGVGTAQATISSSMIFTDDVVFDIQNRVGHAAAGALTVNGNIISPSSVGGLIKQGPGTVTFAVTGGSLKAYSGPTIIKEGRFRHSTGGIPSATSSVTVESGGQLHLISGANHTYGASSSVVLTLNGFGRPAYAEIPGAPIIPALPASPGAILVQPNGTGASVPNITNLVHLASDSSVSIRNAGTLTFSNTVSGPGRLFVAAGADDLDNGTLELTAANTYSGGTTVQACILQIGGAAANVGVGDLVVAGDLTSTTVTAQAIIKAGVANAIFDASTLSLAGGGAPLTADQAFLTLESGVNETVGGLILGGVAQTTPGTYGSSSSPATFKRDEFFSGNGVVTLLSANDANFDNDLDVDGADFLTWQRHFGGPAGASTGDATGDGVANASDFAAWKAAFGPASAVPSSYVVPEPGSAILIIIAVALAHASRNRS